MRSDSVEISPILCTGACSRSPVAALRTAYCQTVSEPLATSVFALPPALPSSCFNSSSGSPITISSLAVITLNSDTLSAASAGSTIMLPIRQARARPRPARFDICILRLPHSGARQARKGKTKPRATGPWSRGVPNAFEWLERFQAKWIPVRVKKTRQDIRMPNLFRQQLQRRGVDAVAQARRAGAVIEDVAEMAVAFRAQHLGADHAVADIVLLVDMALCRRLRKARPAAAGVELGVGFEQGLAAAGAGIGALAVVMLVFAGEGPFGGLLAQHRVLHRRQFLAPLGLALDEFSGRLGVGHSTSLSKPSVGDLGLAHQRRLLDVVVSKNLLQVLDLRNVVEGNIGLVRVQRQIVLVIGLRRVERFELVDLGDD